jgi:hypothetical protein
MASVTSSKTYAGLAALQAADAVACAIPVPYIAQTLDNLGVPAGIRWVLPVVKAAAAAGLVSVVRFPRLARLTTVALTLYFLLAVGAHLRARDKIVNTVPAASLLLTFAAMAVKGPDTAPATR